MLLVVGALFMLVSLSYAEGTAAIPETGGAAMLARRAFNDPIGFLTGWVLLLDYAIVIALAALFMPHYFGHAIGWLRLTRHPWDVVAAVFIILAITLLRLIRRPGLYRIAIVVAVVAFVTDVILIVLGFAFLFSPSDLGHGAHPGVAPTWHSLAFALPVAMLAYTGLETLANLAQEAREPGKSMPRSLFVGLGAAVLVSALIGDRRGRRLPRGHRLRLRHDAPRHGLDPARRWSASSPPSRGTCRRSSSTSCACWSA